jgi:hypothetical protein
MIQKILVVFLFWLGFIACNNSQNQSSADQEQQPQATEEIALLNVANFNTEAGNHVGKQVQIKGIVNHTCKHGGKRMFIVNEGSDVSVKIEAGETISSFNAELEGSEVLVTGYVNELIIDEAYLKEWEMEISEEMNKPAEEEKENEDTEHTGEKEHSGDGEHSSGGLGEKADMGEHTANLEKIENYRKQISESGKDHLSFYSVECTSYEVIPAKTE